MSGSRTRWRPTIIGGIVSVHAESLIPYGIERSLLYGRLQGTLGFDLEQSFTLCLATRCQRISALSATRERERERAGQSYRSRASVRVNIANKKKTFEVRLLLGGSNPLASITVMDRWLSVIQRSKDATRVRVHR